MARFQVTDDHTAEVIAAKNAAIHNALDIIGDKVAKYAGELAPKDTGALKISFDHIIDDSGDEKVVYIGSELEYAVYQELGTGNKFSPPPEWIEYHAKKGRGLPSWRYKDENGEWHTGYPIKGHHMLQRAVENHKDEFETILKNELQG